MESPDAPIILAALEPGGPDDALITPLHRIDSDGQNGCKAELSRHALARVSRKIRLIRSELHSGDIVAQASLESVFANLALLLEQAAQGVIPPEKLHLAVLERLERVQPQILEDAVRYASEMYPSGTDEYFLLRTLPGALSGSMKDIFVRALTL
jgi:hypothetical protein